MQIKVADVD